MNIQNQQILLVSRPVGKPDASNFKFVTVPVEPLKDGQVLVKTLFISVDPYMRGRMSDRKSYVAPYELNAVVAGGVVGRVVDSKSEAFAVGDIVLGDYGWQTYHVASEKKIRIVRLNGAPISTALGALGMTGLTAYFGLLDIGQPKEGETVVVSGAAGAVGSVVGQIAKLKGARVVGIAGSAEKVRYLTEELGFDAAVNYKEEDVFGSLRAACPNGVDVYFDNVGGQVSDFVLRLLNHGARVPICGQIAQYNLTEPDIGQRAQTFLLIKSAMMKGFIVSDYAPRFAEGASQLGKWYVEGKIKSCETIVKGFDQTVNAFLGLFTGENIGKQLVQVEE
jgi:NADPH:quinone reductase